MAEGEGAGLGQGEGGEGLPIGVLDNDRGGAVKISVEIYIVGLEVAAIEELSRVRWIEWGRGVKSIE